ncbi:hypothetical protein [Amycolatopsis circi]|uniref:hypothetical protein n=1 Tax=Amycolatopsis circi TaxID=871959 RepID=UPI000E243C7D|nr:hypothetical protein [Amycolatopsis circi]
MDDHRTDDALGQVREGVHELAEAAPTEARRVVRVELKRWWPKLIISVAVVVLLIVVGGGYAIVDLYFKSAATSATLSSLQQAQAAKAAGEKANSELQARGQPTVPIPDPGSAPDPTVIAQAATAQVLASLSGRYVPFTDLGPAIARYFAANPVTPAGPSPQQLFDSISAYYQANPPTPAKDGKPGADGANGQDGANGKDGKDGHTPTAEEIQAIFADYLRQHPEALCPNGGQFAQIRVQLADGGAADTWQCVVATYPAPSKTPSTTPTSPGG